MALVFLSALVGLTLVEMFMADLLTFISILLTPDGEESLIFTVFDIRRMQKEIHKREEVKTNDHC
jgi:hypothetical protein